MQTFVAPGYSREGIQHFHEYIAPESIRERLGDSSFLLGAYYDMRLIGLIELRNFSHIALLFTAEDWHGRGVAKTLLEAAIAACRNQNRELRQLTVNSSSYALPAYEKLGFIISEQEQTVNGIRFTPMVKLL